MISIRNTQLNPSRAHLFLLLVIAAIISLLHRLAYIFLEVSDWRCLWRCGHVMKLTLYHCERKYIYIDCQQQQQHQQLWKYSPEIWKNAAQTVLQHRFPVRLIEMHLLRLCELVCVLYVQRMYKSVCVNGSVCSIYYERVHKVTAREQMPNTPVSSLQKRPEFLQRSDQ